jgi:hypothetical protein
MKSRVQGVATAALQAPFSGMNLSQKYALLETVA